MDELTRRLARLTPAQRERLAARLANEKSATAAQAIQRLPRDGRKYPLSFAQQRLWLLQELEPDNPAYNLTGGLRLVGDLDEAALEASLGGLIERHETLRTRFTGGDDGPWQIVEPSVRLDIRRAQVMPEDVAHHAAEEAAAVFDLEQGPPLRARLLRLSEREHVLLITFHHIACDGWSLGILLREWSELYRAFREERAPDLAPIQVQYADFAVWQRERFQGEEVQLQMNYWRERLAGVEPLELPCDHRRPEQSTYRGARMKVQVGRGLKEQLERLSRDHNVTLFITLLSVFQLLLHRYSGQSDIVTGVPVAGRRSVELEGLIGFFVNTLALRTDLSGDPTFAELLQRTKETAIGAYSNQDIPFEQVAAELEPLRTVGRSPIFQAMFGYQNAPQGKLEFPDLQWEALDVENTTAKFDLTLNLQPDDGGGLAGALEYSCDLFEPQTAARIANHWMNLLEAAAANPNERISRLEMMSGVERQRILEDWNGSAADMGEARELGAIWEEQAARTPDRIAVEAGDSSISFGHLDRLANGVARQLRALGVQTESCVGVCLHRGERLAAAMLGVWKAGSAWVPLDPMQPSQRLAAMIADAGVKAILCDRLTAMRLPECTVARVYLDDVEPAANPPFRRVDPDNLAYVIFTSGSTGRPKGVLGTHRAMYNRFAWMWRTHPFEANDVMAQKTASSFVDAIWEMFGPLLCGVRLVTIDEDLLIDPPELAPYLSLHQVTRIVLVPSLLRLFLQSDSFSAGALPALRHWTSSGEALPPELLRQFREQLPQSAILNLYGSSEVAADSTCWDASTLQPGARVPAGKPIFNTRIYVLDAYGDVVPVGVTGELYIGGAGVARGYAGDPAMTAWRFTPDPFSAKPGDRRYRTGDMARWTAGGDLEILGRADSQVKIRGMRIELDEVRACLESHPSVREAVVAVRVARSGEASLVAYVIPLKGASISLESLRRHVRERAPEYMVPGAMVVLERMPLTRSGKVDRQALPEPQAVEEVGQGGYRSQTEEIVGGIWSEVLGREKVGRKENFFELGGHSLLATQVVARVRKALGVEIALRALFEAPTVAGLSRRVEEAGAAVAESALERVSRDVPLPASFGQQRLWFLQQMEPQSAYYNCPGVVRLRGELDEGALERSLREIVRRHEVLRTRYRMEAGELRQIVGTGEEFTLRREELRGPLQERLEAEARRPFDLGEEIPVRALLLRVGEQEWVLSLTLHHIAADGWSMGVLVKELNAHYRGEKLEELGLQYGDYAVWERGRKWEEGLKYWKQRLAGMAPWLELPVDRVRTSVRSYAGNRERVELSEELSEGIGKLSRRQGVSEYMTLLAAFQVVLWRYSGQQDIAVGTALGGREREELEELIGLFINTVVIRGEVRGDAGFEELLGRVKEEVLEGQRYGGVPFEQVVEAVEGERSLRHGPLVQVMFLYEGEGQGGGVKLGEVECEGVEVETGTSKFDVTLSVSRVGGRLKVLWEYSAELWEAETARRMLGSWVKVVESAVAGPGKRLRELEWVREEDRRQVVEEWNGTGRELEGERNVVWRVEREAEERGEAVAVEGESGEQLSYGELNRRANGLARELKERGLKREERVGVCVERGVGMVVGLLGVLKAGGAYVPLEPGLPGARLRWMLEDTGARMAVVDGAGAGALGEWEGERIGIGEREEENLGERIEAEQLAYVIYTSGSTGKPKGAGNTHRALLNRLLWMQEEYGLERGEGVLHKTPFGFDVSVWELFWPLMTGARLVIAAPDVHKDANHIAAFIVRTEITTLHFVPSMLRAFLDVAGLENLHSLRRVICSGEALPYDLLERFYARVPAALFNLYGPTEAAIDVTHWPCRLSEDRQVVPIGRPIANLRIYILDAALDPVPVGVPGHLHIAGVGLARGYERQPDLTAEYFIPDPFSGLPGARMYRSGDLARWLAGGEIEYLGRGDHQVKIRGVRIEPGEIEMLLAQHEAVKHAIVQTYEFSPGDSRLAAYVVANDGASISHAGLREFLRDRVSEHMMPSAFVTLDALPLSRNGKLDRKQLPPPQTSNEEQASYVAPRTEVERLLAGIWADLLSGAEVGAHDDFFDRGGHSLLAMQMVARIRDVFRITLSLRLIFERPRLDALAEAIAVALHADSPVAPPVTPVSREGGLPLSFAQQRLWFLDQLEPGSSSYNCAGALRLNGTVDCVALARSMTHLVERHEILRTIFRESDRGPKQVVLAPSEFQLEILHASSEAAAMELAAHHAERPFDLKTGPLLMAAVIDVAGQEHWLSLSLHHIVSDGWSLGLIFRELSTIYDALRTGSLPQLSPLPVQYADYAAWQRRWMDDAALEHQLAYWKRQLGGAPDVLHLPADRPRPAAGTLRGARRTLALSAALSRDVEALSRREGTTVFMTLLAAFQILLFRYSGETDIVVGSPIAGRNRTEFEGLIGFFINTLALRANPAGNPSCREFLARVRELVLGAYAHQDIPFEQVVAELRPERSLSHSPLFQVMFDYIAGSMQAPDFLGMAATPLEVDSGTAKFDLTLTLGDTPEGLRGSIEYATDLFDDGTIERMVQHFEVLLAGMVRSPELALSELPLMTHRERQQMVEISNGSGLDASGTPIPAVFEEFARVVPDRVALVAGGEQITYEALNRRANRLSHLLRGLGARPEMPLGVYMEKSADAVTAILAVLKTGAAYVPLDRDQSRTFQLRQQPLPIVITHRACSVEAAGTADVVCCIDENDLDGYDDRDLEIPIDGASLAYVVFTSGSTGEPKRVMVSHEALASVLRSWERAYALSSPPKCHLQMAGLGFDVFTGDLVRALCSGGRLVLCSRDTLLEPAELYSLMKREQIECAEFVPAVLRAVIDLGKPLDFLKLLIAGSDVWSAEDFAATAQLAGPGTRVINSYGVSEAAIDSTVFEGSVADCVPIGKPLANTRLYIVDGQMNPMPLGIPGEIYLGGSGLARGYLGRPELTAERWVPDPFSERGGERLYRTGDRGRWNASGQVEYLGRMDQQVKIRGFRIEPGEIEAALAAHAQVREAAVVPREGRLIAYVAGEAGVDELRRHLGERLPDYMIPGVFVAVAQLPRTPNGKLDRRALPEPGAEHGESSVGPRNRVEAELVRIWAQTLGLETVGVNENFFQLGGDSILSIQIVSRARQAGLRLTVREMFQHQTIAELAAAAQPAKQSEAEQGEVVGKVELTPIQRWFFEQEFEEAHHWNQSVMLKVGRECGRKELEAAWRGIVRHHDGLRQRFVERAAGWEGWQAGSESEPELEWMEVESRGELERLAAERQRSLDLTRGPMVRATVFDLGEGERRLSVVAHHLVIDGVSWRILLEDLERGCRGEALPAKTTSWRSWTGRLKEYRGKEEAGERVEGWPVGHPEGGNGEAGAAVVRVSLGAESTQRLLRQGGIQGTLLAALTGALTEYSGQSRVRVEVEGHGREEAFEEVDITRTVGWFTTVYPVVLEVNEGEALGERARRLEEKTQGIDKLQVTSTHAAVSFNYLGQFEGNEEGGGLFEWAEESSGAVHSGKAHRAYEWEINAAVRGGRLWAEWVYAGERYERSAVERAAGEFVRELEELAGSEIETSYELTPMQQGMLFHMLWEPEGGLYYEQMGMELEGEIEGALWKQAWQEVVNRHEGLRTEVHWEGRERPVQVVKRQVVVEMGEEDWSGLSGEEYERRLEAELTEERRGGFRLDRAPLLRLRLLRKGAGSWECVWSHPHLTLDGWAMPVVMEELLAIYGGLQSERKVELPAAGRYRDYVAWLGRQEGGKAEAYWRRRLEGVEALRELPGEGGSEGESGYGQRVRELSEETTGKLEAMARGEQVTLNTLVQGAWSVVLSRYSGQEEVVFGATVSGRPAELAGVERTVGLFLNTLPVRVRVGEQVEIGEWLRGLQAAEAEAREYEYASLAQVQGWSGVGGGGQLFESLVVFENYPVGEGGEREAGVRVKRVRSWERTNYAMTLVVGPGKRLRLRMSYQAGRFTGERMERVLEQMERALEEMAGRGGRGMVGEIDILGEVERRRLLELGRGAGGAEELMSVVETFEARVREQGEAVALVSEGEQWSYRELNEWANGIAWKLMEQGVGPETRVGLVLERGAGLVAAVLGVLKAGGAYVPMEPGLPEARLRYMEEDAAVKVVLRPEEVETAGRSEQNPPRRAELENLAYLIYTSGSTGLPKAVLLTHRNLAIRCAAMIVRYGIDAKQRVPLFISLSFDASAEEIYPTLAAGGALVLPPDPAGTSIFSWLDACEQLGANTLHFPASYWSRMTLELETAQRTLPPWLRLCIVGGESLDPSAVSRWFGLNPRGARLFNAYGPTETTISAAACELRPSVPGHAPIGRPLDGTVMYVLDEHLNPTPAGASGELFIGGSGVARCYGNRPDLTASQFLPDPFSPESGARLYRTGDRARLSSDGEFEFLGRADRQVKIRGFRVDLGEIESVLQQHPDILEAAVTVSDAGLTAYVSPQSGTADSELARYLKLRLPEHMLPGRIEQLAALPRTVGGKIDYRALPEPSLAADSPHWMQSPSDGPYLDILIGVCRELAGHTLVDGDDSFFEMGGNSLLAIQLVSRIRTVFGVEVSLQAVFEAPTLSALARTIAQMNAAQASHLPAIEAAPRGQRVPVTFAQESLWRVHRALGSRSLNHVVQALHFQGSLNAEALEQSLLHLVRRHEALRTSFYEEDGVPLQRIEPQAEFELGMWDLSQLAPEERVDQAQAVVQKEIEEPFDLSRGPLFHAALLHLNEEEHILVLATHHIIADGWSMRILTSELVACYSAYSTGASPSLPELPAQFAAFALWERACFREGLFDAALTYWRRQLAGAHQDLHFASAGANFEPSNLMAQESLAIGPEASHRLTQWAQTEHSTPFIALCTAWKLLLRDYSATGRVSLCTLAANRTRSETEGVFGLFLNTLILRSDLSGVSSFVEAARKVRATALAAYAHQSLPFELLLRELEKESGVSRSSLARAMLVFESLEDTQSEANGIQISPATLEGGGGNAVSQATTFDLVLTASQSSGGIELTLRYRADRFECGVIQRQLRDLKALIESSITVSPRPEVRRAMSTHSVE